MKMTLSSLFNQVLYLILFTVGQLLVYFNGNLNIGLELIF